VVEAEVEVGAVEPHTLVLEQRPLVPRLSSVPQSFSLMFQVLALIMKTLAQLLMLPDLVPKILGLVVPVLKVPALMLLSVLLLEQTPLTA
jgi:hypothetical protein